MKRTILLLSLLAVVMLVPVAVSAEGNLLVSSAPPGAAIFISGSDTGQITPYNFTRAAGSYSITVRLTGYVDQSSTVTVTDGLVVTYLATMTAVSAPTISGLSPSTATNSAWQSVEISGTGFNAATVSLTKTGESAVAGAVLGTDSTTLLTRNFNLQGLAPGTWTLVVFNSDGGFITSPFIISAATAGTLTQITPTSGVVNTTVSITFTGTGFVVGSAKTRLYQGSNYIIGQVVSGGSSTSMAGTFDLSKGLAGTYDACILYDGTDASKICKAFSIVSSSTVNGSFYFTSNPSHAGIYLNNVYKGTTPLTLDNVSPATYTVLFRSSGYQDLSKTFVVTAGSTTNAYGYLNVERTETVSTPVYTVPTTVRKTITTIKTIKVPTPWPTSTPTKSPTELFVVIGAVGLCFAVLRKR